jgi:hypothetical protein
MFQKHALHEYTTMQVFSVPSNKFRKFLKIHQEYAGFIFKKLTAENYVTSPLCKDKKKSGQNQKGPLYS